MAVAAGAANYPYFHPDHAGQMLKPPHPVAVAGYLHLGEISLECSRPGAAAAALWVLGMNGLRAVLAANRRAAEQWSSLLDAPRTSRRRAHCRRWTRRPRGHSVTPDADGARVLRSVLMKPESEQRVPRLHRLVAELAR